MHVSTGALPRLVAACLVAVALGACQRTLPLNYFQSTPADSFSAAGKAFTLEVIDRLGVFRGYISVFPVYSAGSLSVRPEVPVQKVVRDALAEELAARGIVLAEGQSRTIEIQVTAMHTNVIPGLFSPWHRSIAAFTAKVTGTDGSVHLHEAFTAMHEDPGSFFSKNPTEAQTLEVALARALKVLLEDPAFALALSKA